jgi:hypothetical protein
MHGIANPQHVQTAALNALNKPWQDISRLLMPNAVN